MRRASWGTDSNRVNWVRPISMTMLLCWAEFWNCPKPSDLESQCISLDTYSAKLWGSSGVERVFVLPLSVAKNYDNSLFYSTKFISKEVTPMILIQMCTLYRPRQASMTPYNLFGKSLFSHFHTEPLFRPGIISKILHSILQYTNKMQYKSSFFFVFFNFFLVFEG